MHLLPLDMVIDIHCSSSLDTVYASTHIISLCTYDTESIGVKFIHSTGAGVCYLHSFDGVSVTVLAHHFVQVGRRQPVQRVASEEELVVLFSGIWQVVLQLPVCLLTSGQAVVSQLDCVSAAKNIAECRFVLCI